MHGRATRRRAACLVLVAFLAVISTAGPTWATSVGIHPGTRADVILIFKPQDDHVFSIVDEVVRGEILKVERGLAPRLIISPAGTLGPAWKAGVPIRLYLLAFTDRSAHYPIGVEPAPVPRPPAITVAATQGVDPVHATAPGQPWFGIEAQLTAPDPESTVRVDVYVGITRPDGERLSIVKTADDIPPGTMIVGRGFLPILTDVRPTPPVTFRGFFGFEGPRGWYTVYGLVTPAGADPTDPRLWLNASFFPILLTSP